MKATNDLLTGERKRKIYLRSACDQSSHKLREERKKGGHNDRCRGGREIIWAIKKTSRPLRKRRREKSRQRFSIFLAGRGHRRSVLLPDEEGATNPSRYRSERDGGKGSASLMHHSYHL